MSQVNDTLSVTPEPAIANSVKTCNCKLSHPGHWFQDETFGDIEHKQIIQVPLLFHIECSWVIKW